MKDFIAVLSIIFSLLNIAFYFGYVRGKIDEIVNRVNENRNTMDRKREDMRGMSKDIFENTRLIAKTESSVISIQKDVMDYGIRIKEAEKRINKQEQSNGITQALLAELSKKMDTLNDAILNLKK